MASSYAYYIRGNQIALVEKADSSGEYESPSKDVASGIRFEYSQRSLITSDEAGTAEQIGIITEVDYVQVDRYLAGALIYYIKGRLAEDSGEIELKEYFNREFRAMLSKYESSRFAGPRIIQANNAIR